MTELERRAMLGDIQAQEECTRQGVLLPCPFCGGAAIVEYDTMEPFEYTVVCEDCGVVNGTSEDKQVAVSEWNTRPAPPIGRCKNCKNLRKNNENEPYCLNTYGLSDPQEMDFCSYFELGK